MHTTSDGYKKANLEPVRQFESDITIGARKLTNEDLISFTIQQSIQQDETFSIGNVISSCLNLVFLHNDIDTDDRDIINLKLGLLVDNAYEYIPLGIYNINSVDSNDTTTTLVCYDNMVKFDIAYTENSENPTVYSVINRLVSLTGVQFGGVLSDYKNYNLTPLQGYSCREVLSFIAGALGSNATIDRNGKFNFVSLSIHPLYNIERFELATKDGSIVMTKNSEVIEVKAQVGFINADNYYDYTKKNKNYKIKQVVNMTDTEGISLGSTDENSVCLSMQNPFVNEEILKDIYSKMNGLEFLPYSLNWIGDVSVDVGDLITVTDKKGVMRAHPVLSQTIIYNGALNVISGAQGDTKLANTYVVKTKEEAAIDRVKDDVSNTVSSVEVMYYLSTSKTELRDGEWTTEAPEWEEDKYIWTKTVTEYNNGDVVESEPICITGQRGLQGIQGEKGDQGIPGVTYYTWIKYADDSLGNGISDSPDGKKYIGFAYNKTTNVESNNKEDYTWSLIQGEKGDTGVKGADGADGKTYYTWIKYSDNANGNPCYDTPTSSTQYIGIAVNQTTATESSDYTKYTWSKFKGDQGVKGETGANGKTSYFHIKYSSVANPTSSSQMTETPSTYIGTYVDYTEMDSDNPKKYTWARFEGLQGVKGEQGIPGVNGEDGKTSYLHIKYSNDGGKTFTSNNGEDVGMYIGTYTDFNINDSGNVSSYTWNKVKGQGIDSITEEYAINSDKENAPTTGWSTTCPPWETGKYLWTRSKIIYNNPTETVYTTPYCDSSWEAVNEIEVGGRNFIKNSSLLSFNPNNTGLGTSVTMTNESEKYMRATPSSGKNVSLYHFPSKTQTLVSGETYIYSLMVRSQKDTNIDLYDNVTANTNKTTSIKAGIWTKVTTNPAIYTNFSGAIILVSHVVDSYLDYKLVKLEIGNKATDWTPAPEDIYSEIEKVDDRISLIVSDGSTQSNLSLTPSAISAIAKDIKLKASNITLEGLVTANNNFKILSDGSIEATNGKFTGDITGSNISGGTIESIDSSSTKKKSVKISGASFVSSVDTISGGEVTNIDTVYINGGNITLSNFSNTGMSNGSYAELSNNHFMIYGNTKVLSEPAIVFDSNKAEGAGDYVAKFNGHMKVSGNIDAWNIYKNTDWSTSKATNGYCKLPNGVIIQWGYQVVTPTAANTVTTQSVTFPITFPSACRGVQVTARTSVPNVITSSSANITSSGFEIAMTRTNTTATGYSWFAIGY